MTCRFSFIGALILHSLLASCVSRRQTHPVANGDLVGNARHWRQTGTMASARDELVRALGELDAADSFIEKRLMRANADKSWLPDDALARVPKSTRQRTGIFFVLGYRSNAGLSERVIRNVVGSLRNEGWNAVLMSVPPHQSVEKDADTLHETFSDLLPEVDQAIVIGFSKGSLDILHWFAAKAEHMPSYQRQKIRVLMNFAGVLRGAVVADWLANAPGPIAGSVRLYLRAVEKDHDTLMADVNSIACDPWDTKGHCLPRIKQLIPNLRVVNLVAIPEAKRGFTRVHRGFSWLSCVVSFQWRWTGPLDGMAESAAQVLPSKAEVPQHIVRVFGSHALLDGHYSNGKPVSKAFRDGGKAAEHGGDELLGDLLRAIPKRWAVP